MSTIINVSKTWNNGIARTLTKSGQRDPYDNKLEFREGGVGPCSGYIDGRGNLTLKGHMCRVYLYYRNYNAALSMNFKPNFVTNGSPPDDINLRLRSRHHKPMTEPCSNRIGGASFNIRQKNWIYKRENCHNVYITGFTGPLSKPMVNGRNYYIYYSVKDEGSDTMRMVSKIDHKDGMPLVKEMEVRDKPNKPEFFDKNKILNDSICWIRFNGTGSITVSNVKLELF